MAKSLADLNLSIANATAAANAAAAALKASGASADFTDQVSAVDAITATLNASVAPPASGTLVANPVSVNLSATSPTQSVSITGATGAVNAVSSNPAVATVAAPSPNAPLDYVVTRASAGSASLTFTDAAGNSVQVPVTSV